MPEPLHIQLLGGFQLSYAGRRILSADSASGKALVAYLLLQPSVAQARQQIAFQLWPESSEHQAMSNLRALLVRSRRAWPEIEQYVDIGPRSLRWRNEIDVRFDVADFESALARAEAAPEERQAALEHAIRLYRGDLFPACYQEWILPVREGLRQSFLQALAELAGLLEAAGEYAAAIGAAQQLLHYEPLDETLYQRLMRLQALRGDRAGLTRVFDTCATALRQELAIEPSAETRALFQQLLHSPPTAPLVSRPRPAANHNLALPLTSFVGRQPELAAIKLKLQAARLLTLTGAGGSGKTRLAWQAAWDVVGDYEAGVWWTDLAPVADPQSVWRAVAKTLGVQEQAQRPLATTLAGAIDTRRLLLILDNCEHLIGECAALANTLLAACPNLSVLATSRQALGMTGEALYPVPPLKLPDELDLGSEEPAEAVQLFVERAALGLPTFVLTPHNRAAVSQICRRLDGIPLAIELAAARVKVLTVAQIAARLDDRFSLLTGGSRAALPRHQTLRAMVDWSYALLSGSEQALFRRLAVFSGGFTLEAAEAIDDRPAGDGAVTVLETLSRLIDKSLVQADQPAGELMRYRLLETIRQYGLEKLEAAAESQAAREQHAAFIRDLLENADQQRQGAFQKKWLRVLELERDNLRAALAWAIENERAELAVRLAGASGWGWGWVGHASFVEGRAWLERAVAVPAAAGYPAPYARTLLFTGAIAFLQSEAQAAKPWLEQAVSIARAHAVPDVLAEGLDFLGLVNIQEGDLALARAHMLESRALCEQLGLIGSYAQAVWHLGLVVEQTGDKAAALDLYAQALALFQQCGDSTRGTAVLRMMGWNHYELGHQAQGQALLQESLALALNNSNKAEVAHTLRAIAERRPADSLAAVTLLGAIVNLYHALGLTTYENAVLEQDVAARRGQFDAPAFDQALAAGRALALEQTVAVALA